VFSRGVTNEAGMTPMMVYVLPLSGIDLPMICSSLLNCLTHKLWLNTTTKGAPLLSSSVVTKRPRSGPTPKVSKKPPVTCPIWNCIGSLPPV
jgi:hypothetical protein